MPPEAIREILNSPLCFQPTGNVLVSRLLSGSPGGKTDG